MNNSDWYDENIDGDLDSSLHCPDYWYDENIDGNLDSSLHCPDDWYD